ncbi:hypothetical protein CDD83_8339 [Cordyceps sp. RAO-2017]|nr:hypothetical protein CDD83_8339 [Cordyceps sp. RAO-2017]
MVRSSPRKKQAVNYSPSAASQPGPSSPKSGRARPETAPKRKAPSEADDSEADEAPRAEKRTKTKAKAKAKTKTKGEDSMPLAERTAVTSLGKAMYIGAHVSAAGGVHNSVTNAVQIGANAFALFLKSQRKWESPPMSSEARDLFVGGCEDHGYSAARHALPHGSYLVNLAQSDEAKAAQAYRGFVDDLQRCEQLGIRLYNFHPGSTLGDARPAAIARIAAQLNKSHRATKTVVTVLENMAGSGNVLGSTWEDLRDIIALVEDKDRVGVCIDTCHAFAAGHDLRTPEAFRRTMDSFNEIVGAKYLKAFHLNDSKAPFDSNRDLHANIGTGFLGLRAFHSVVNEDAFRGMPMILETPIDRKDPGGKAVEDKQIWADEIKLLESLVGMDPDGAEFTTLEAELQAKGADERSRIQGQVDKKSAKSAKGGARGAAGNKAQRKGRKRGASTTESEGGSS